LGAGVQSIYWVVTFACHRRCRHCYDDRFRPYVRGALDAVLAQGERAIPRILANLPDDMRWRDAGGRWHPTQLVLAGGELLIDGVRQRLFHPLLAGIADRWGTARPRISVQTTGDILTDDLLADMLARGVDTVAVASIDDHHAGHAGQAKFRLMDRLRAMMTHHGMVEITPGDPRPVPRATPTFLFFGAQPDLWIGEIWPRGRAWLNGLSTADYTTNFCARWSGGKGFLDIGRAGSEVAIEPDGSLYPCCLKTAAPLGNLTEERLLDILADLRDEAALQSINRGDPEGMGLASGWSRDDFRARAATADPLGRAFANPCIGCDRYFAERLGPVLAERRRQRLARRGPPDLAVERPVPIA
jgi:hypothetical protein